MGQRDHRPDRADSDGRGCRGRRPSCKQGRAHRSHSRPAPRVTLPDTLSITDGGAFFKLAGSIQPAGKLAARCGEKSQAPRRQCSRDPSIACVPDEKAEMAQPVCEHIFFANLGGAGMLGVCGCRRREATPRQRDRVGAKLNGFGISQIRQDDRSILLPSPTGGMEESGDRQPPDQFPCDCVRILISVCKSRGPANVSDCVAGRRGADREHFE
jgi:hypothetical protein